MKKLLLTFALLVVAMTGTAQIESGFRSGFSISGSVNSMTNLDADKMMFGYRLGYTLDYNFSELFYLGTGLEQTLKGGVVNVSQLLGDFTAFDDGSTPFRYYNLQLPINVGGRLPLGKKNTYLFAQAGPYVSYVFVTNKYNIFGYGEIEGERFDWGLGVKAGVEFKYIQIHLGYDFGLAKVWNYAHDDNVRNNSFYFGMSFMF